MKLESPSVLTKKFFFARPFEGPGPPCLRQCTGVVFTVLANVALFSV